MEGSEGSSSLLLGAARQMMAEGSNILVMKVAPGADTLLGAEAMIKVVPEVETLTEVFGQAMQEENKVVGGVEASPKLAQEA